MAKKKYYQGMKDRMDESRGMKDPMRRREYEDSMMIREDRNAIANLPQDVKYVQYPQSPYYKQPELNDTIRGVDRQLADDAYAKALKKSSYSEKF